MELLYSGTVNARTGEVTDEFLDDFISMSDTTETLDRAYIRNILNIVEGKEEYLKGVIRPFLKDWDINRLSRVNLSILKIAAGELLFTDIPERVSLNEAIELSKIYSDEESTAFINGVLDKILKAKNLGDIQSEADFANRAIPSAATPAQNEALPDEPADESGLPVAEPVATDNPADTTAVITPVEAEDTAAVVTPVEPVEAADVAAPLGVAEGAQPFDEETR